ncbi:type II and III secretion system protein family protein [Acidocella sp.]|jgi:pilus assembly protein CpaC|uniref:type II and III secretion system protein family protein n=1 Tax=Acidocella sp. TaxID=50710 RepID=UPI002F3F219A
MSRHYARLLLAVSSLGLSAGLAQAQPLELNSSATASGPAYVRSVSVAKGSGKLIKLPGPMANLFAADPSVVEVRPASPDTMFVFGKDLGQTTIVATDQAGTPVAQYTVVVGPSAFARNRLQAQAQAGAPGADVTAESEAGGMIVRGTVQTPEEANNVMNQARLISPTGTVVNQLQVREPIQVELKVRIATMSRTVTRELGIDWGQAGAAGIMIGKFSLTGSTGTGAPAISGSTPGTYGLTFPGGTFQGIIDALASDNLAHVLAEPTLTTLSGTQASFQVGGQFPIPISETNGAISITFKNFGILLTFTPTVFSDGRIALQVAPQLSTLSTTNGVTISSSGSSSAITVPSLNVTQASSTVILGSGQGMAIAGLLEDTSNETSNAVPVLGEVPVLGALFRGDSFQREQQEMVITVTPYLVNPVDQPATLASPDDGWTPPNDLQRILLLRDNGTDAASATIPGDAGFMVQ